MPLADIVTLFQYVTDVQLMQFITQILVFIYSYFFIVERVSIFICTWYQNKWQQNEWYCGM